MSSNRYSSAASVAGLLLAAALVLSLATTDSGASISDSMRSVYRKARYMGSRSLERLSMGYRLGDGRSLPAPAPAQSSSPRTRAARNSDDYRAMCVFSRGPTLKSAPVLFYFSSEVNTPGCEVEVEIELAGLDDFRQLDEPFATSSIKNKLLDTGYYNPFRPTYFIIHGFLADWRGNWLCETKDLILNKTSANIFIVDWSGGSKPMMPLDYGASVSNTQYVATLISEFVELLLAMTGQQDARSFHLIGHSLGAHISGFVGYNLGTVGQITGLDPAGPCFTSNSVEDGELAEETGVMHKGKRRLSPQSANYVLALHTDTILFGLNENCAHYDVYVNGGDRQPQCGSLSATSRLEDLMHLNLGSTFNLNLACCHSYAHKLLDSLVDFSTWRSIKPEQLVKAAVQAPMVRLASGENENENNENNNNNNNNRNSIDRCYPMAYQCLDWSTFTAGECGFCRDNDSRCVFAGISLHQQQARKWRDHELRYKSAAADRLLSFGSGEAAVADDDDARFNNEDDSEHDSERDQPTTGAWQPSGLAKRGQHFLKAGAEKPICLFHYQVLVAVRDEMDVRGKHYYYLHIPLERSGKLTDEQSGEKLQARLVQVSHRIDARSPTYESLRVDYMRALAERVGAGGAIDGSRSNIAFYSTLITFKQAPRELCAQQQQQLNRDSWQLCEPAANLREARLWSSSAEKLEAVEWVALNYMSGFNHEQRMSRSYLMQRAPNEPIKRRDELETADQAKLSAIRPRMSNGLRRSVSRVARTADLVFGILNCNEMIGGDPRQNYRCRRSGEELKYAVSLNPHKL